MVIDRVGDDYGPKRRLHALVWQPNGVLLHCDGLWPNKSSGKGHNIVKLQMLTKFWPNTHRPYAFRPKFQPKPLQLTVSTNQSLSEQGRQLPAQLEIRPK